MPRGKPKRGEYDFTIWFEDGFRFRWHTTRSIGDAGIADGIRKYLLPILERIEARQSDDAVDRQATNTGTTSTRD